MKNVKLIFAIAALFLIGIHSSTFAHPAGGEAGVCEDAAYSGEVIIVETGLGTARCGFPSMSEPIEFAATVREDYNYFPSDFAKLMDQVYSKLNITNTANHPVLVVQPDGYNSWRRVDMSDEIMGKRNAPWMYVTWQSIMLVYGHNKGDLGSGIIYHSEHNKAYVTPVYGGWPYDMHYAREMNYYEPELVRRADSVFWVSVGMPYDSRPELLNNIILSGSDWDNLSAQDIATFEDRINIQRLNISHDPTIGNPNPGFPHRFTVYNSARKMCDDGILVDWDLAFQQSLYQEKGSDEIRRWIF